jgi:hypothetical protein
VLFGCSIKMLMAIVVTQLETAEAQALLGLFFSNSQII